MIKKIELFAFDNKVKFIKAYMPEKIKLNIENKFSKELKYFKKKYAIEVNILGDERLIIPEYKIEYLNKSKKLINNIEYIDKANEIKEIDKSKKKTDIQEKTIKTKMGLKKSKKIKTIKKKYKTQRTLWVRRKKTA